MATITTPGDFYSLENGRGFGVTLGTGWFLVIYHQNEHDAEPPGSYLIETWDFVPSHAKRVNIHTENHGGMGINISLALTAALNALTPSNHVKVYIRQTPQAAR